MILATSRNSLVYLEHCKIVMSDNRLGYVKSDNVVEKHYSIPYVNMVFTMAK